MEEYSVSRKRTTLDRKNAQARARRARKIDRRRLHEMMVGPRAVAGLNLPKVEDAIARAPRRRLDAAGKQRRIGPKVAKMVKKLLMLEGKGEMPDFWVHKTRREWTTDEVPLTMGELRTARRVAGEEGLFEEKDGFRPSDGQRTTFYRLDMWAVARVVMRSELERYRGLLECERRPTQRSTYEKRVKELLRASSDLAVVDRGTAETTGAKPAPDPANPEPQEGDQISQHPRDNSASLHPGTRTRVPSTDVYSVGDGNVAKASPADASISGLNKEGFDYPSSGDSRATDSCAICPDVSEEALHAIRYQIDLIFHHGGTRSGDILGPMAVRHLKGRVPFWRLVKTARGFVKARVGDEDFARIVADVLDEMRAEGYVEDGYFLMGMDHRDETA